MRIAQIANFIGPSSGGVKTAVNALGKGYAEHGCARLLVIPGPLDHVEETPAGRVVQLRGPQVGGGYRLIVEPWRIIEVLEDFAPDSVELADKVTVLPISRWARRRGVHVVLFNHEHLYAMLSLRTGLVRLLDRPIQQINKTLVGLADTIVVTSEFARNEFYEPAKLAGTPVVTVPLGVDLEAFGPSPRTTATELRLTHIGRLSREKSPHLAVRTAVELHERGVPLRMDVYGDGPHRHELEAIATGAPVYFHGYVHDRRVLARAIGQADVALSVCPGETFGLAVLEALACGTPVVTANCGGARELVTRACGDWGEPNPHSLADAVQRLQAKPQEAVRRAARDRAELYPWSRTIESMLAIHDNRLFTDADEFGDPFAMRLQDQQHRS